MTEVTAVANGIWIGVAITAIAWMALRLASSFNAATRYGVWWAVLVAVAISPFIGLLHFDAPVQADPKPAPVAMRPVVQPSQDDDAPSRAVPVASPEPRSVVKTSPRLELPLPRSVPEWIALAWLAGILFGVVKLLREAIAVALFRSRTVEAGAELELRFAMLCRVSGLRRRVRLALSTEAEGPVAIGPFRPMIVLPAALEQDLTERDLDQVLLHEIAHIHRRDDQMRVLQRLIEIAIFFQPAAWWLGRRLDLEREIACDDQVIAIAGRVREYAACLTRMVEISGSRRAWALAAGVTGTKSQLRRRVETMFDKTRNTAPQSSKVALIVVAIAAVLVTAGAVQLQPVFAFVAAEDPPPPPPAHPAIADAPTPVVAVPDPPSPPAAPMLAAAAAPVAPPAPPDPPSPAASNDVHWHMSMTNDGRHVELTMDGVATFNDSDSDIQTLAPNGKFILEENVGGTRKRYEVRSDSKGNLTRAYTVDGAKRSPDEARGWLAGILPEIIRESGVDAGPRIQRIVNHGGPAAGLREIGLIHSDHSRRVYVEELLNRVPLDRNQLTETMRLVRGISSDGEKARAIIAASPRYFETGLREPMFDAIDTISSDGDHRRVLSSVVGADGANTATAMLASKSAARISSDGEKAAILVEIADTNSSTEDLRLSSLRAANTISSDGEKARVLLAIARGRTSPVTLAETARAAQRISSDGEKARVLLELSRADLSNTAFRGSFFSAVDSISSDGDKARVLSAVLRNGSLPQDAAVAAVRSAARISSDGEKASVLVIAARTYGGNGTVQEELRAAAKSISSDGEFRRVRTALDRQSPAI